MHERSARQWHFYIAPGGIWRVLGRLAERLAHGAERCWHHAAMTFLGVHKVVHAMFES